VRLKLDENLGRSCLTLLREANHDVATVHEEGLSSADDHRLIAACRVEQRCLVTLDLNFANPLVFVPAQTPGIAVFRLPRGPTLDELTDATRTFVTALAGNQIGGKLWIVQRGRIRE
jgi:predicted nuclease of predicted toxin-antitoxin system